MAGASPRNPVYEFFGVEPVINAGGTHTTHGGSRMKPEVLEAMAMASQSYVPVLELNRKVGEFIAKVTGAEAGMVTSGAAGGITLATAAAMTGTDVAKIRRLPDTSGTKGEIVMQMHHYGGYGRIWGYAGAKVVLTGTTGGSSEEELEAAINENTAAVGFLFAPGVRQSGVSLSRTAEIAHKHGLPVIVDSAAMLPPRSNLRRFISEGADLAIFSGGKFIGGPQATGLMFGKKELIEAAIMNSSPNSAIGRPQKVAREEVVGMGTALRLFMDLDEEALLASLRKTAEYVASCLKSVPGINVEVRHDYFRYFVPTAVIEPEDGWKGPSIPEIAKRLHSGSPRIYVASSSDSLNVNPFNLQPGEEEIVVGRLLEELKK